jgi:hypothetical protein
MGLYTQKHPFLNKIGYIKKEKIKIRREEEENQGKLRGQCEEMLKRKSLRKKRGFWQGRLPIAL